MFYGFYRDKSEELEVKNFLKDEKEDDIKYKFTKGKITPSIYKNLASNDIVIIYDLSIIDDSAYKIIDKLANKLIPKEITIFVLSTELKINSSYFDFLYSIYTIENKGITQRINRRSETIEKLRNKKPIKTKPSKSMFDKHKKIIFKLYNQTSRLEYILKTIQEKDEKLKNTTIQSLSSYIKKIKNMESQIKSKDTLPSSDTNTNEKNTISKT